KLSNETLTKLNESDNKEVKKEQVFIDLPFIGIETKTLGKKIIDLAKNIRPGLHIQPIPRPPPAMTTFFPQKDKINKNAQSNIVYSIETTSGARCITTVKGPPTPKIVTPVLNNQSTINECNVEPQEENDDTLMKSALYEHQMNMNHTINWNDWKIISKDCKKYRLLVLVYPEGLQISKPTVKIKFGAINEPRTRANS
ncbi:unnamed protein product, partial [Rotaria magnacalcarata]